MKNNSRKNSICSSQPIFTERNEIKTEKSFVKKNESSINNDEYFYLIIF